MMLQRTSTILCCVSLVIGCLSPAALGQSRSDARAPANATPKAVYVGQKYAIHDVKYIRARQGDSFSIVARLTSVSKQETDSKSTKAAADSKLGTAIIKFDQPVKGDVGELQIIDRTFNVTVGEDGNRVNWRVTAAKGSITGTADDTRGVQKMVFDGRNGAFIVTFRGLTAQKQYGVILHEGFLPVSNTPKYTLMDFKPGDATREYDTLVAGLPKTSDSRNERAK